MSDETKQDHTVELAGVELEALRSGGFKEAKSEAAVERRPAPEPEEQEDQTSTIDSKSLRLLRESQKLRALDEARNRELDVTAAGDDHDETRSIDRSSLAQMLEAPTPAPAPSPFGIIKKMKKLRQPKKDDSPTKERAKPVFSLPSVPSPAAPLASPSLDAVESDADFELEELVDHGDASHVEASSTPCLPEPPVGLETSDASEPSDLSPIEQVSQASDASETPDLSLIEQVSHASDPSETSEEGALDDVFVEAPVQEVGGTSSISIEEEYASEAGPIVTTESMPELGKELESAPTREPTLEMDLGAVLEDAEKEGTDKGVKIAIALLCLVAIAILGVVAFVLAGQ